MRYTPLLIAAMALSFAGAALADGQTADISGAWTFQTGAFSNGCKMSGQMRIARASNGKHLCTFNTHEVCRDIAGGAEQSCTAERKDGKLTIKSKVLKVQPDFSHYYPDDFALDIISGSYMKGHLHSAGEAPVEFFRGETPVS